MDARYHVTVLKYIFLLFYLKEIAASCDGTTSTNFLDLFEPKTFRYPMSGTYGQNLNCQWLFTSRVPDSAILSRVANSYVDCGDSLKTYDGNTTTSPELESTGCSTPPGGTKSFQLSTQNELLAALTTDGTTVTGTETGFEIQMISGIDKSYSAEACSSQKTLTATSSIQYITTPNFPNIYHKNTQCTWVITAESSIANLLISIIFMDLDEYNNACVDTLNFIENSVTMLSSCGRRKFSPDIIYTSAGSNVTVQFTTGNFVTAYGFSLSYKQNEQPCNGGLQITELNLFEPLFFKYPENGTYDQNSTCQWLFTSSTPGSTILSRVADSYVDCEDTLKTYDGNSTSSPELEASGCSTPPGGTKSVRLSTQNELLAVLTTDGTTKANTETGFELQITSGIDLSYSAEACSSQKTLTATSSTQYITTPNFPNVFDRNTECQWVITAEDTNASVSVAVTFMDLDEYNGCVDKLEFIEGSTVLDTVCGRRNFFPNKVYTSDGQTITVKFTTGNFINGNGFSASYKQNVPAVVQTITATTADSQTTTGSSVQTSESSSDCDDGLQSVSLELFKPMIFQYPESGTYGQDHVCEWLFTSDNPSSTILSRVANSYVDCDDSLKTYDGNSTSSPALESNGCSTPPGATKPIQLSTGNEVLAVLTTDNKTVANTETGFQLQMISGIDMSYSAESCVTKTELTATSSAKYLTSPNFPQKFVKNTMCTWIITAENPTAQIVLMIHFKDLDQYSGNCYDYLNITEGGSRTLICERNSFKEENFTSNGNTLTLQFTAGNFGPYYGFALSYQQFGGATTVSDTTLTTVEQTTTRTTTTEQTSTIESTTSTTTIEQTSTSPTTTESTTTQGITTTATTQPTTTTEEITTQTTTQPTTTTEEITTQTTTQPTTAQTTTQPTTTTQSTTTQTTVPPTTTILTFFVSSTSESSSTTIIRMTTPSTPTARLETTTRTGTTTTIPETRTSISTTTTPTHQPCKEGLQITNLELFEPLFFKYPTNGTYDQNMICQWLFISSLPGSTILSRVANSYVDCGDVLKTYDGNTTSSPELESSGCSSPPGGTKNIRLSTQNDILASLITDGTTVPRMETGFELQMISGIDKSYFQEACITQTNLKATSTEQYITSPNFPNVYNKNAQCTWVITAEDKNAHVSVAVKFMDLDEYNGCVDKLKFIEKSTVMKVECGRNMFSPNKFYTSNSTTLTIEMTTGNFLQAHGFSLSYKQNEQSGLTGSFTVVTPNPRSSTTTGPQEDDSNPLGIPLGAGIAVLVGLILILICGVGVVLRKYNMRKKVKKYKNQYENQGSYARHQLSSNSNEASGHDYDYIDTHIYNTLRSDNYDDLKSWM